jgi:hypothetical protein
MPSWTLGKLLEVLTVARVVRVAQASGVDQKGSPLTPFASTFLRSDNQGAPLSIKSSTNLYKRATGGLMSPFATAPSRGVGCIAKTRNMEIN